MADFYAYTLTIEVDVVVPAVGGDPPAINAAGIPAGVKAAVISNLSSLVPSVATPRLTWSEATEVTLP